MRLVTHLLLAASLVFAFIFLQHHYGVGDRFLQWWNGGTKQTNGFSATANPEWPAPADHDYKVIIDVSGKGPFMSVIHGAEAAEKKIRKGSRKHIQQGVTKDQPQAPPATPATPTISATPPAQATSQSA